MKMGVTAALTRPIKLPPLGDAVATTLVIQGVLFVLTAMVLDGGLTNRLAWFALLFYWASFSGVLLMRVAMRNFIFTRVDAGIVKFSYFAYLLMLPFLDLLAAWIKGTQRANQSRRFGMLGKELSCRVTKF